NPYSPFFLERATPELPQIFLPPSQLRLTGLLVELNEEEEDRKIRKWAINSCIHRMGIRICVEDGCKDGLCEWEHEKIPKTNIHQ
ncbi:hypothetical protein HAX54_004864, partial [Datura stramonium]|nr:hypothetical protein [Datura stramonium]